ncbi:hypothetical protein J4E83_003549 [Alternaria metachromatica]|uniref:uncharacterized protein n=1 Tax=Alternaria metachromatica TaxID=283354 RepID=UPI0020C23009|nr:uncharacterized protein J4E83_003549 [Alternaria metachromatica]KAI4628994.1 hypothetical protein J4E83_003549 [Alternaria metachromatica]
MSAPAGKRIFLRHVKLFLTYRCKSLYGAPTLLPSLVRNVVEHFMTTTSQTSEIVREAYTDRVCHAIVNHLPEGKLFKLATRPTLLMCNKAASNPVETYCLTIAILMEDKELVTHYLSQSVSVWNGTEVFEIPLKVAAQSGAIEFVAQLLENAKSSLTKSAKAKPTMHLSTIIDRTIRSGHWNVAIIVIDWWFQHLRKPLPASVEDWVIAAAGIPTTKFLHRILDYDHTPAAKARLVECLYYSQTTWGVGRMNRLARALINRNILDPSKFYSHVLALSGSLLALAVEKGDFQLATRYLKLGLSPNGLQNPEGNLEYPLVRAVKKRDETMVRLLLDHDADPEPAQRWISKAFDKSDEGPFKYFSEVLRCDWRKEWDTTENIEALICQAAQAKDRREKETFTDA